MALDDEGDDEVRAGGPPLPPDDRLWRHPSELGPHGLARGSVGSPRAAPASRPPMKSVALVGVLVGAGLVVGVLAITGSLSPRVVDHQIIEKVAVTPVVSSPMMRGERGVAAVAERLGPSIVRLDIGRPDGASVGSGVLFRDDGLVLTSAQVVLGATSIGAVLSDGRRLTGRLVGLDAMTDVALVDLDGQGFPVAVLGTTQGIEIGAPTIAIGSPHGAGAGLSVTTGVISALDRRVNAPGGQTLHGMIQTDAPIVAGSSGGALVDASGAVIGIVASVEAGPDGRFGFATPIDLAHRVAQELLATGHMAYGWLGVEGSDLTTETAQAMQVDGGALVEGVTSGSPAAAAGLTVGDVITELGDQPVTSISRLVVMLRTHNPGDTVVVGYWRAGRHATTRVTLADRP